MTRCHRAIASEAQVRSIVDEAERRCPVGDNLLNGTPLTVVVGTSLATSGAVA